MNEEIKKKLEEMAKAHWKKTGGDDGFVPQDFMAGAQAAWELAHQTTEDDERDAKAWRLENPATPETNLVWYSNEAFLAGRRGLREAVDKEHRKFLELAKITNKMDDVIYGCPGCSEILNPKDGA